MEVRYTARERPLTHSQVHSTEMKRFLSSPLPDDVPYVISAGWEYEPKEIAIHGIKAHEAIDFRVPRGTPVHAAADGWAIATFEETSLRCADGSSRRYRGKTVWYGGGLLIQVWHGRGRYTQYLHLERVNAGIPLSSPIHRADGSVVPNIRALRAGLGWGAPTYTSWRRGVAYRSWDKPHLHFTVLGRRAPRTREAQRVDPFGVYGRASRYPRKPTRWPMRSRSLWLPAATLSVREA